MEGENTWMIGFVGCVGGGGNGRIYYRKESMNCREDFEEYLFIMGRFRFGYKMLLYH